MPGAGTSSWPPYSSSYQHWHLREGDHPMLESMETLRKTFSFLLLPPPPNEAVLERDCSNSVVLGPSAALGGER